MTIGERNASLPGSVTEEVEVEIGESGHDLAIENEADQEAVVMKITDAAGSYKPKPHFTSYFFPLLTTF